MKSFKELCAKNEIHLTVVRSEIDEIAHDRTEGMVNCFLDYTRNISFMTSYRHLRRLVASAYMQGVVDAAEAMARQGTK